MKATFFERLGSYVLDMIIVSFIFSIISLGFGSYTTKTEKQIEELETKLLEKTVTPEEYLAEYQDLLYDYQKENILELSISLALTIAYYVVFQYMNKGQTLGKKMLGIRVVDKNTKKPISIIKGLLRSLLIMSILSGILNILFIYILNKNIYFEVYSSVLLIETAFILVTTILVLYKKDGRGLHDIMANTIVIKESR